MNKILLDTNILIEREDNKPLSEDLQKFSKIMNEEKFKVYIHPASFKDIEHDSNKKRREITESKFKSYDKLINPPKFDNDNVFKEKLNINKQNDYIDGLLLYALYKDQVDFLITEDIGIHKLARKVNLEEQVLTIKEAITNLNIKSPNVPPTIRKTTVSELDINDPIFDSLKKDYEEFEEWFNDRKERKCLKYIENNKLGAVLIYKDESENISLKNGFLPLKNRTKISTMIVSSNGNKIGELFISWIVDYAIKNKNEEIYLTHFIKKEDYLVYLIEEYGFKNVGRNNRGENVFIKTIDKNIISNEIANKNYSFLDIAKKYYPYYCDNENVRKFIVPIRPEFHEKLFLENDIQTKIETHLDEGFSKYPEDLIANNTIKKAYLSHSQTKLKEGDLLIFYESDKKGISNIGVVESYDKADNLDKLLKLISKRSVFTLDELKKLIEKELSVILFIHSKKYENKLTYDELIKLNIFNAAPQHIQKLDHEKYLIIKENLEKKENPKWM